MKCEEKANLPREKVDEWWPGAGRGNREWVRKRKRDLSGVMQMF